jgi:hypothetical protein
MYRFALASENSKFSRHHGSHSPYARPQAPALPPHRGSCLPAGVNFPQRAVRSMLQLRQSRRCHGSLAVPPRARGCAGDRANINLLNISDVVPPRARGRGCADEIPHRADFGIYPFTRRARCYGLGTNGIQIRYHPTRSKPVVGILSAKKAPPDEPAGPG